MQDVATRAGVALSSASRALSDHPDVSRNMRRRVQLAARELGYEPNFLAQSLRTGSTRTVGFVIRDIANPYFALIARGAERLLRERGFGMMLVNSDGDPEVEADHLTLLRRRRVDGLILNVVAEDHPGTVEAVKGLGVPYVLIDREIAGATVSSVRCDHFTGVRAAVMDLLDHGHRRVALITGPRNVRPVRERIRGVKEAFADAGLTVDPAHLVLGAFDSTFAEQTTNQLLDSANPPTALVAGGAQVTIGVVKALHQRGLVPGRDLGLVALDELDLLEIIDPPISVVARDPQTMGSEAARLLLDAVAGKPPEQVVLQTTYQPGTTPMGPAG